MAFILLVKMSLEKKDKVKLCVKKKFSKLYYNDLLVLPSLSTRRPNRHARHTASGQCLQLYKNDKSYVFEHPNDHCNTMET